MKRLAVILVALMMLFALLGCHNNSSSNIAVKGSSNSNTVANNSSNPNKNTEVKASYTINDVVVRAWDRIIGGKNIQVTIEVENTGTVPIFLQDSSLDLETPSGELLLVMQNVSVSEYPSVLKPGMKGYYVGISSLTEEYEGEFVVRPHLQIEVSKVTPTYYPISDPSIKEDSFGGIKVMGRVENNTNNDETLVTVVAVLFDIDGRCLGVLDTYVDIRAGDKVGFECSALLFPDNITIENVGSYTIMAYPMQFQF